MALIGHSMDGMIATRYVQRYGRGLAGLALSGPALGRLEAAEHLLELAEIPDTPE